jgi:calcineurin-like phosphoesterase family protein
MKAASVDVGVGVMEGDSVAVGSPVGSPLGSSVASLVALASGEGVESGLIEGVALGVASNEEADGLLDGAMTSLGPEEPERECAAPNATSTTSSNTAVPCTAGGTLRTFRHARLSLPGPVYMPGSFLASVRFTNSTARPRAWCHYVRWIRPGPFVRYRALTSVITQRAPAPVRDVTVFYTSDLHIGHPMVAAYRGYPDSAAHDGALRATWLRQVRDGDQVWILGDLSPDAEPGLAWLAELPGEKHLVAGNHDRVHPGRKNGYRHLRRYLEVFDSVQPFARHKIGGVNLLLSHFPYTDPRTPQPRNMQWRLPDRGEFLAHGHTHATRRLTSPREVHVGIDAWQRLVSQPDVADLLGISQPFG